MVFTDEVQWSAGDFLAAVLLMGAAYAVLTIAVRVMRSRGSRAIAAVIILLALLAVWAHRAIGIWN
jgi:hypothetical protein